MGFMVALAATEADPDGSVVFMAEDADTGSLSRRVNKTKTLDGGVYLLDQGFVAEDQDFSLTISNPTQAIVAGIQHLVKSYDVVLLMSRDGAFLGAIETLKAGISGGVSLTFLTSEKVSA
ncbi:MAG: hypothetical protein HQL56_01190 [Magnetococcales bacterium]|nr:hypothetical protein [Magnetococcales bacterium]